MNSNSVIVPEYLLKCRSVNWNTKYKYDEKNFLYCVIRHIWTATQKVNDYQSLLKNYEKKFNLKELSFPLQHRHIRKFLRENKHLPLTIRVFHESEERLCPLNTYSNIKNKRDRYKNILNLLLIKSDCNITEKNKKINPHLSSINHLNQQHHFFTITNLRGFLNGRKQYLCNRKFPFPHYYCEVCLMDFSSKNMQKSHQNTCQKDKQTVIYPEKGEVLKFSKQRNCFKAPIIGFADFESYMSQPEEERKVCNLCNNISIKCDCEKSSSHILNMHKACAFSICFVDSDNDVFYQETYSGEDAVEVFLSKLPKYEKIVYNRKQRYRRTSDIKATPQEWHKYHTATVCAICKNKFNYDCRLYKKVVDHDHVSGGKIQAAHSICNLQRQGPYLTPIYFHNAQGLV